MVFKTLLILVVIAVLMEDSLSIKKSPEEEKEEREMAEKVNATLAEEEKKRQEENEKKEDEREKKPDQGKKKNIAKDKVDEEDKRNRTQGVVQGDQDEACPVCNNTCPVNSTCPAEKPCKRCPEVQDCPPKEDCRPCEPCLPCPGVNSTVDSPPTVTCPEVSNMSTAVAMVIGAVASLLVAGVATGVGLLLRYVPPIASGFLFLATIVLIWYLCSQYPDTARELGGRAATLLREAATALSHRIMEALRHHNNQVGFS
jgi:hypothetical protein